MVILLDYSQHESFCFRIQYGIDFTCRCSYYCDPDAVSLLFKTLLQQGTNDYSLAFYTEENVQEVLKDGTSQTGGYFKNASMLSVHVSTCKLKEVKNKNEMDICTLPMLFERVSL